MNLQERIAALLEFSGMNIPRFAKYIGCPTQFTIRDILSGKTKSLSFAVKTKILAAYPEINERWLETGEGLMTNSQSVRSGLTDCQRVDEILSRYKLSVKELALALGLKNPQIIYNIKNNRCGISDRFSEAIMEKFPEINAGWLLTGEGEMFKQPHANPQINISNFNNRGENAMGDFIKIEAPDIDCRLREEISALKSEIEHLKTLLDTYKKLVSEQSERITDFKERITELKTATK